MNNGFFSFKFPLGSLRLKTVITRVIEVFNLKQPKGNLKLRNPLYAQIENSLNRWNFTNFFWDLYMSNLVCDQFNLPKKILWSFSDLSCFQSYWIVSYSMDTILPYYLFIDEHWIIQISMYHLCKWLSQLFRPKLCRL